MNKIPEKFNYIVSRNVDSDLVHYKCTDKQRKEENTCSVCGITYENFQSLANHSCLPYRCKTCSAAFLYDFKLKMHKCDEALSTSKEKSNDSFYCDTSRSPFLNSSQYKSIYSANCEECQKPLKFKCKDGFCCVCRKIRKKKSYPLRKKKVHTNESKYANSRFPLDNGIGSSEESSISTNSDCASTDRACVKLKISNSTKKKKSNESSEKTFANNCFKNAGNRRTGGKHNEITTDLKICESVVLIKSPFHDDQRGSRYSDNRTRKNSESPNLPKKRRLPDSDTPVIGSEKNNSKNINDESVALSKSSVKERSNFTKKRKSIDSDFLLNSSSKNCSVMIKDEILKKTSNTSSDLSNCRSSVSRFRRSPKFPVNTKKEECVDYSVLDNGSRNICSQSMNKDIKTQNDRSVTILNCKYDTKIKFNKKQEESIYFSNSTKMTPVHDDITAHKNILTHSLANMLFQNGERNSLGNKRKTKLHSATNYDNCNKRKKDDLTDTFQNSDKVVSSSVYSKSNIKIKKERLFPKKSKLDAVSTKNSKSLGNKTITQKIDTKITSAKVIISPVNSKRQSVGESGSIPQLEVLESTLTAAPERTRSPARSSTSKDNNSDNGCNSKKSDISNSDSDVVKLEYVLNSLPDEDSGVLLRISSESDNFRCLKCNKLFKKIKIASSHYVNCKGSKTKKKMMVSFHHIEWICLHCHYHCKYLSDLTVHKRSCHKSSSSGSIENFIRNYSDTCRYSCSKCNYSCLSSVLFNRHSCEKEFQRMKHCFIGVTKLDKPDLQNSNLSKYECKFCESLFFNYVSYKKHYNTHKPNEILTSNVNKDVKDIIKTPDDMLNGIYKIVSNSNLESNSLFSGLNLNFSIPASMETLLPDVAEKIIADEDQETTLDEDIAESDLTSPSATSASCAKNFDGRTEFEHLKCECPGKSSDSADAEHKPCLKCLNEYLNDSLNRSSRNMQNSTCSTQDARESGGTVSSSSFVSNSTESSISSANVNTFLVPPVSEEMAPIEISAVASYYQTSSDNVPLDVSGCGKKFVSVSGAAAVDSNTLNAQSVDSNVGLGIVTSDSFVMSTIIKKIILKKINPKEESVYNVGIHVDLLTNLTNLRTTFPPKTNEENISSKILLSEEAENVNSNSSNMLQHLSFGLGSACSTESKHGLSPSDFDGDNSSSNLLTPNIQQRIDSVLQSTDDYDDVPFSLETDILAGENGTDSNGLEWKAKLHCPFDKLMEVLVNIESCDMTVVAFTSLLEIHVSWIPERLKLNAIMFCYSDSGVCCHCFTSLTFATLLPHFNDRHKDIKPLHICIGKEKSNS